MLFFAGVSADWSVEETVQNFANNRNLQGFLPSTFFVDSDRSTLKPKKLNILRAYLESLKDRLNNPEHDDGSSCAVDHILKFLGIYHSGSAASHFAVFVYKMNILGALFRESGVIVQSIDPQMTPIRLFREHPNQLGGTMSARGQGDEAVGHVVSFFQCRGQSLFFNDHARKLIPFNVNAFWDTIDALQNEGEMEFQVYFCSYSNVDDVFKLPFIYLRDTLYTFHPEQSSIHRLDDEDPENYCATAKHIIGLRTKRVWRVDNINFAYLNTDSSEFMEKHWIEYLFVSVTTAEDEDEMLTSLKWSRIPPARIKFAEHAELADYLRMTKKSSYRPEAIDNGLRMLRNALPHHVVQKK
jgi:hypothetical protein